MELNDTKLQVLNEHYNQTLNFLHLYLKKRDRLFAAILVVLIIMLFQLYAPQEASALISKLLSTKLGLKESINFLYIQSIIWFVLLAIIVKYFQSVVYIERQYGYLHSLEKLLNKQYGEGVFTREGASYLKDYPTFLNWTSLLYTVLFPAILVIVSISKIISEFNQYGYRDILIWFNGLIFVFIGISIALFLIMIYSNTDENKDETEGKLSDNVET